MTKHYATAPTSFRRVSCAVLGMALALGVGFGGVGCTSAQNAANSIANAQEQGASASSGADDSSDSVQTAPVLDESAYDFSYTDRDFDATYDASTATTITWQDGAAQVQGQGAAADGATVTIEQEGVYVLSGSAANAQVAVCAADDAKVQLVLDGLNIESADGPAIYVQQAKKCFITLAAGSENSVADSSTYTLADGADEPDAAIFSKCNLTIQGEGSLAVAGNYSCGIKSKDDLVVTGGNVSVTAVGNGIVGRDRLSIAAGNVAVDAQGNALKSTNEAKGKGFVSITGGQVSLASGDAGIKAENLICITDGSVSVDAQDDALHSNGDVHIAGGQITASSGDDGIHADDALQVDGGAIDITQSYEGLEGHAIYLNDGDVSVVSSDDGLNAANPDATQQDDAPGGMRTDARNDGGEPEANGNARGGKGASSAGEFPEESGFADKPGAAGDAPSANEGGQPGDNADQGNTAEGADAAGAGGMRDGADAEGAGGDMRSGADADMGAGGPGGANDADDTCVIVINGGTVRVDAQGDGIDSNGSLTVNGGTVLVSGPTGQGDGALDYESSATINGGTVIAAGSSGMAVSFTQGTQAYALINAAGNAGDEISIVDSSGNVAATFAPAKAFECVVVSSPIFADNDSCSVAVDGQTYNADSGQSGTAARREPIANGGLSAKPTE